MAWTIEWDERALRDLRAFDRPIQQRIRNFLRDRVARSDNPRRLGHALKGAMGEFWRYRVGDHRILCRIEDDVLVVLVVRIGHRRDVYRRL